MQRRYRQGAGRRTDAAAQRAAQGLALTIAFFGNVAPVLIRGPSPDRLTTEAAAPQRHVRSTNTIQEYRIPATGFTDPPATRQLQSLPLQGREGS